jgi:hypothetical protein
MTLVLLATALGCVVTFSAFVVAHSTQRMGRGLPSLLARKFSHDQVEHFTLSMRSWAVFLPVMGLGFYAVAHEGPAARVVLGLYVLATSIAAVSLVDWLWKGTNGPQ